ncbi:MAG: hypothetical protein MHPSP_002973, partial [Paramarteilia canceri]
FTSEKTKFENDILEKNVKIGELEKEIQDIKLEKEKISKDHDQFASMYNEEKLKIERVVNK